VQITQVVRDSRRGAAARQLPVERALDEAAAYPSLDRRIALELPEAVLEVLVAVELVPLRFLLEAVDDGLVAADRNPASRELGVGRFVRRDHRLQALDVARLRDRHDVVAVVREIEPDHVELGPVRTLVLVEPAELRRRPRETRRELHRLFPLLRRRVRRQRDECRRIGGRLPRPFGDRSAAAVAAAPRSDGERRDQRRRREARHSISRNAVSLVRSPFVTL
jgi:hypothetical protein